MSAGQLVLVDTAPWIYLLDGHPDFQARFTGLFEAAAAGHLELALTSITMAEVLVGPLRAGNEALALRYEQALGAYRVVGFDPALAVAAARIRARQRLKLPDAIQLASALHIGAAALVTHDRDFSCITSLPVLDGPERRA